MDELNAKPSILAVTRHSAFLRALRLEMPLLNLKKQGLIRDYFITNPSLFDVPDDFLFDVVWLQRVNDPRLMEHVERKAGGCFLYDLDDLLIGRAAYLAQEVPNRDTVIEAIRKCRVLTVTSLRLARLAEKYAGCSTLDRAAVCPNAFEFHDWVRVPQVPSGIIVTSSEELPVAGSSEAVISAIVDFSARRGLPIALFGRFDDRLRARVADRVRITEYGSVSYWHYHGLLAALPPMIGIAALETDADLETLDFVNGKSDVKMVDFGGFGHPSVYSAALPYVDTDLKAGVLAENTYDAWTQGLESVYRDMWRRLDAEQREIISQRSMDRVAAECWLPAVERARLPEPMTGRAIRFHGGTVSFYTSVAKHLVFSQDYEFRRRVIERVPRPIMALVRRFLLDT